MSLIKQKITEKDRDVIDRPRGRLRTLGLVEYPSPGLVRARGILFP